MGALAVVAVLATAFAVAARAEQCGRQAGDALCPNCLCCSQFGWCGSTSDYCGTGCQSQCSGGCGGGGVASIVSRSLFDQMLLHRNDQVCAAKGFYTYDAFVAAANAYPDFATTGDTDTRKREVAAFLAQTSHETTGGWPTAPDGPYSWGYCFKEENGGNAPTYCQPKPEWPCAPDKKYYGRGPIQITYNYNYGPAGQAIGSDLLNNPDLVASRHHLLQDSLLVLDDATVAKAVVPRGHDRAVDALHRRPGGGACPGLRRDHQHHQRRCGVRPRRRRQSGRPDRVLQALL